MRRNAIAQLAAAGHDKGDMEVEPDGDHVVVRMRCGADVMEVTLTPEQAVDEAVALMLSVCMVVGEKALAMFENRCQKRMAEMLHGEAKGQA